MGFISMEKMCRIEIYELNFIENFTGSERFIKKFKSMTIYLEVLTVTIVECDRPVRRCVDDGVWVFPFAVKFPFSEEFYPGIKH